MSKTKEAKKQEPRFRQLFKEEDRSTLLDWWRSLDKVSGARAQLRRAASPEEAVLHPQTHRVMQILPWASPEAAATIAGILSHIKTEEDASTPLGQKLAKPSELGGSAPFSESRFRQLLSSRDVNDFYRNLRRAIQVLGGNANPLLLADLILCWDKESRKQKYAAPGKSLKFWLSRDYYTEAMKHESKSK